MDDTREAEAESTPPRKQTRSKGDRATKRLEIIESSAAHTSIAEYLQQRTDALRLARCIAIAGLPKKRSKLRGLVRNFRLGAELWLRVVYTAGHDSELPYGQDRFVLSGIQHLAIQQDSPIVRFEEVSQLLKMFGLPIAGKELFLLRQRFLRLSSFSISLIFAKTKELLNQHPRGENTFVIRKYKLPTRVELRSEKIESIDRMALDKALGYSLVRDNGDFRFGVVLDDYFFKHLKDTHNHLIVPLDMMKLFIDRPIAWDYMMFLVARCGAAKSDSVVDHDTLMGMFKDSDAEPDRNAIARLKRYHDEIMKATDNKLNAQLEHVGYFEKQGTGAKPKRWALKVGPSKPIVESGKRLD